MKEYIIKNILSNKRIIQIFIFCIALGLASGILSFNFLDKNTTNDIILNFKNTIELSLKDNFESVKIVTNGFKNVILLNGIFFIITFIFFAPIIICVIFFLKGFSIGVLVNVIFNLFDFNKGIITMILIVIIPNLIYLITMIYNGIKCVNCYYDIINKFEKKEAIKSVVKLSFSFIFSLPFYFLSIVLEQLLFPIVLSVYK